MTAASPPDTLYVGFSGQVVALNRSTGNLLWTWKAAKGGRGFVALLLDEGQLFASVSGYTYCLDPVTGKELWFNPLEGLGVGIPTLVTINRSTLKTSAAAAQEDSDADDAAAASAAHTSQ